MALILMRHPAPAVAPGICYGASDIALSAPIDLHAFENLPRFGHLVSSPLARCRLAAEAIGLRHGLAPILDPRLREMDFGAWEGRRWDDIPRAELDGWAADFLDARPHGGESVAMLAVRVTDALDEHRRRAGDTLIITHAGVIRAALQDWRADVGFSTWVVIA